MRGRANIATTLLENYRQIDKAQLLKLESGNLLWSYVLSTPMGHRLSQFDFRIGQPISLLYISITFSPSDHLLPLQACPLHRCLYTLVPRPRRVPNYSWLFRPRSQFIHVRSPLRAPVHHATALHYAVRMGDVEKIRLSKKRGARVDVKDLCGETVMDLARE